MIGLDALKGIFTTDSLYKFGVVAGCVVVAASILREVALSERTFSKVVDALMRVDELSSPATDPPSSIPELAQYLAQIQASTPDGRAALMEASMYVGYLQANRKASMLYSLLGGGIIGVSLVSWYYCHQRYQDRMARLTMLKAELEWKKLRADVEGATHE